jgi:hypothetical protein
MKIEATNAPGGQVLSVGLTKADVDQLLGNLRAFQADPGQHFYVFRFELPEEEAESGFADIRVHLVEEDDEGVPDFRVSGLALPIER